MEGVKRGIIKIQKKKSQVIRLKLLGADQIEVLLQKLLGADKYSLSYFLVFLSFSPL
jgi:hypothetical protein